MKTLNRPMFRYGGPIKEGIMTGIKEKQAINTVGSPLAPTDSSGRQGYALPLIPAAIAGLSTLGRFALRPFGKMATRAVQRTFAGPNKRFYEPAGFSKNVQEKFFQPNKIGSYLLASPEAKFLTGAGGKASKFVAGAAKGLAKSPTGIALTAGTMTDILPGGKPFLGLGSLKGSMGTIPGFSKALGLKEGADFANTAKVFAGGSLLGGLLNQAEEEGDPEGITRDVGALRSKLINAYKNQRTFSDAADEDAAILEQVDIDLSEYNQDMNRANAAYGGRMSYAGGTEFEEYLKGREEFNKKQNAEQLYKEFLENKRRQKVAEQKTMAANGGRIGFARGPDNPEQNAIQAAGIMNLPLNQNPAGVTELDLRETGGFIPPVGVKEKADDIPAMLSNNEFVFTADAVRGMGEGDVNKGAQRMYDMMKKLEKGGRV